LIVGQLDEAKSRNGRRIEGHAESEHIATGADHQRGMRRPGGARWRSGPGGRQNARDERYQPNRSPDPH
jgi:hypothetical protein